MKARDKGGVVDERLNVYGVQGLKIAGELFLCSLHPYSVHFYMQIVASPPAMLGPTPIIRPLPSERKLR